MVDVGWLATVSVWIVTIILLGWIFVIRWMRLAGERRRLAMIAMWRPILAGSLVVDVPDSLPSIPPRDRVVFLYLWNHLQESIKGESSNALCQIIHRTKMDEVVQDFLATGTMRQQLLAIVTLGHLKQASAWAKLVELAQAENAFLSLEAARALVRIDPPRAIHVLVPLISYRTDWSTLKVLSFLTGAGAALVAQALGEAALQAPPLIAARLLRFLASLRSHGALSIVRPLLARQPLHEDVLAGCLSLFGQCCDPYDLPTVRQYLSHPTWFIRVQAATALGKMGMEEDEAPLIELLQDAQWWVRYRAAEALSMLPSMTDDKLAILVQTLPTTEARKVLTPFVAKRMAVWLAASPSRLAT